MKRITSMLLLIFFISSCSCKHKKEDQMKAGKNIFSYEYNLQKYKECDSLIDWNKCDFNTISSQIPNFTRYGIASVPICENLINHCISSMNENQADELFRLFYNNFISVVNLYNDSLYANSALQGKLLEDIKDNEISDFKKCISFCKLELLASEGDFYIAEKYDFFYDLFKNNVSQALKKYLELRSKELKDGFSEDAELLISFEDLYQRILNWEDLINKYPQFKLINEANEYYTSYLSTFLTGMDNSPVFDYENQTLIPEVKSLYEKIIAKNEDRKSTKIISRYYELLKAINFKQPEDIEKFMKENELYSMIGVQPNTR